MERITERELNKLKAQLGIVTRLFDCETYSCDGKLRDKNGRVVSALPISKPQLLIVYDGKTVEPYEEDKYTKGVHFFKIPSLQRNVLFTLEDIFSLIPDASWSPMFTDVEATVEAALNLPRYVDAFVLGDGRYDLLRPHDPADTAHIYPVQYYEILKKDRPERNIIM